VFKPWDEVLRIPGIKLDANDGAKKNTSTMTSRIRKKRL